MSNSAVLQSLQSSRGRWPTVSWMSKCVAVLFMGAAGCYGGSDPVFVQVTEAHRRLADIRIQFAKAADAANRAVMADTDEASVSFAREAEQATEIVLRESGLLKPLLRNLRFAEEGRLLDEFAGHFGEYRTLDHSILELAVLNTNIKAQRLSFGPGREAADAFRDALDKLAQATPATHAVPVAALVAKAVLAVREIQVLQAPHIAEADDAKMTRMEQQMATLSRVARGALDELGAIVEPATRPQLTAATTALEQFARVHGELIGLSRRNTNVRSLALSLGRKRNLIAACDEGLRAIDGALAKHEFGATR